MLDDFDVFDELIPEDPQPSKFTQTLLSDKNKINTSFFLSNALLNILVKKGVVSREEVEKEVSLMYQLVKKQREGE